MLKVKKKITVNSVRHAVKNIIFPRWKRILLGLILIILSRVASLVLPASSKYLVDEIFVGENLDKLGLLLLVVGGAVIIQASGGFFLVKLLSVEAHHLISELRVNIQKHILQLPLSFFSSERSGAVVSRIMNDVEGVRNLVGTGLVQIFGGILSATFSLFILMSINKEMTISSLLILVLFAIVMMKAFKTIRPIFRKRQKIHAEVTGRLTETIGGIKVIKSFAAEDREQKVFQKGVHSLYENVKRSLTATALATMITILLTGIISCMVMAVSAYAVVEGRMTTGDFIAYLMYLGLLTFPIIQMSNISTQMTESFAGLDRMNEIYSLPTENEDPNRTKEITGINKGIVFEKVSFSYQPNKDNANSTKEEAIKTEGIDYPKVIKKVSFEIKTGKVVALVGSSGSGKSTLASLALSLFTPNSGKILVDGIDLKEINLKSYRTKLAVVLQDDFLFDGTIKDNLLFAKPNASKQEIDKAIKAAYVDEYSKNFEKGLDTVIGERGVRLSGGQKQRLSIARAILANPDFLVLDEATSSLDNISERYIQASLKKLLKNRTTLIIAHRLSTIEKADKILVIENGKVVEEGNHKSLLRKKGFYYKLYTFQAKI